MFNLTTKFNPMKNRLLNLAQSAKFLRNFRSLSMCMFAIATNAIIMVAQPTNPSPQAIPYLNDFGNSNITDDYLAAKGMNFSRYTASGTRIRNSEALLLTIPDANFGDRLIQDEITTADVYISTSLGVGYISNGLGPISLLEGTNAKLMFSIGGRTFQNVLALNTSGYSNIKFNYELQQLENLSTVTGNITETIVNAVLEYRIGTSGAWSTLSGVTYTSDGKAIGEVSTFAGILPTDANNQPVVQVRWITYQDYGTYLEEYLSFGLDNIAITGDALPPTKVDIISISPSSIFNLAPNTIVIASKNDAGVISPVISSTGITLNSLNTSLTGTASGTILAGTAFVTISGFAFPTSGIYDLIATSTFGDALLAGTVSGIVVNQTTPATKLKIAKIVPATGSKFFPNEPFIVVVQATDNSGNAGLVSQNTTVAIESSGLGTLSITGSLVIPANTSSISILGVNYSGLAKDLTLIVKSFSGDALISSDPTLPFNVGRIATAIVINNVLPGNILIGKEFLINAYFVDEEGEDAVSLTPLTITASLATGTGTLGGAVTGVIPSLSTDGSINGITYSKAESIVIQVSANGLTSASTTGVSITADPNAGLNILYFEDFEKTNRSVVGPNGKLPALPGNMKIFNVDNTSSVEYADYAKDAFVVIRRRGRGITPLPVDESIYTAEKLYYFDNSTSVNPDSNWVAAATSYFSDTQTEDANRWLVTPGVSITGLNIKFSLQALSGTSTGNYKDDFELRYSQKNPGSSINIADWLVLPLKNIVTSSASGVNTAPTVPITYSVDLPNAFSNKIIYFAIRLVTKSPGGDRLYVDNLLVTSGSATSTQDEVSSKSITVFPNPVGSTLYIKGAEAGDINIIDIAGSTVVSTKTTGFTSVDVSGLAGGVYFVKVATATGAYTTKFIKE